MVVGNHGVVLVLGALSISLIFARSVLGLCTKKDLGVRVN